MRRKEDELTPRQVRFLSQVAQGLAVGEAARDCDYHTHHASKLYRSPEGQAFVAKMVANAESVLVAGLPELVQLALQALKEVLESQHQPDRKLKAAAIVLKLAAPLVDNITDATDNRGVMIEMDLSTQAMEANYEKARNNNN